MKERKRDQESAKIQEKYERGQVNASYGATTGGPTEQPDTPE